MAQKEPQKPVPIPKGLMFLFGGLAGMGATCVVQPLDLVKNRMQITGVGSTKKATILEVLRVVVKNEGVLGLYNGLSAGLLRQASYGTSRLGLYQSLSEYFSSGGQQPAYYMKIMLGMVAGAFGAFIGTPAEVALIRMTTDGKLPPDKRKNYKSVFHALANIGKEEGITGLWKGAVPTMSRCVVTNAAQLSTYSQAKEMLLKTGYLVDNIWCHFCSSMLSGLVTAGTSMPLDIAKTRIQNMKTGGPQYKGTFDVIAQVLAKEGITALWKGFIPYYCRIGPHTVLTFIFLEQMNRAYRRLYSN